MIENVATFLISIELCFKMLILEWLVNWNSESNIFLASKFALERLPLEEDRIDEFVEDIKVFTSIQPAPSSKAMARSFNRKNKNELSRVYGYNIKDQQYHN